jgi:hypothetical protein
MQSLRQRWPSARSHEVAHYSAPIRDQHPETRHLRRPSLVASPAQQVRQLAQPTMFILATVKASAQPPEILVQLNRASIGPDIEDADLATETGSPHQREGTRHRWHIEPLPVRWTA